MIDKFSRLCMLVPAKNMKAMTVVEAIDKWFAFYGAPESVLSDNGSQFTSAIFRRFGKAHGVKLKLTTAYHPECNGQIERLHRWVKERLALIARDTNQNFLEHDIQHAYNTTTNQMTKYAPSEIIYGQKLPLQIDNSLGQLDDFEGKTPEEFIRYMATRRDIIIGNANDTQKKYDVIRKKAYDLQRKKTTLELKVGDYVYYDISQRYVGNRKKLTANFVGPWEVTQIFNDEQNVRLVDCGDPAHHVTTHRDKVKLFQSKEVHMVNAPQTNVRNYEIAMCDRAIHQMNKQPHRTEPQTRHLHFMKQKLRGIRRERVLGLYQRLPSPSLYQMS